VSDLIKTRAIVIRHNPHTESSRLIQWVTEDHGKFVTLAKGAMRPRNAMLGQFDQLYTCELVYYARAEEKIAITREIAALKTRPRLRTDWRAQLAAQYIADLTARVMPQHEPSPDLFELLDDALDELNAQGWHAPSLFYYELRLLEALGLHPKLDRCASCNQPFATGHRAEFSSRRGGMVCDTCKRDPDGHVAGADILAILAHWQRGRDWNVARTARCAPSQLATIRTINGDFLRYHLDIRSSSRDATLNLLSA
jgi:DNA repair protein RecO (recombination protein O)